MNGRPLAGKGVPVPVLLERLRVADELDTAQRVAAPWGVTVEELLARYPPRDPWAGFIIDLYERFRDKGYSYPYIAHLTGRDPTTVKSSIAYRRDEAYRNRRKLHTKLGPSSTEAA